VDGRLCPVDHGTGKLTEIILTTSIANVDSQPLLAWDEHSKPPHYNGPLLAVSIVQDENTTFVGDARVSIDIKSDPNDPTQGMARSVFIDFARPMQLITIALNQDKAHAWVPHGISQPVREWELNGDS
jgi:hypothetical protein